jgi:AraC-type DNA-binding domain-containing proteins
MHYSHQHNNPAAMADLFSKIPTDAEYFSVRSIRMKGVKVELPAPPIRSSIYCFVFVTEGETVITIGKESYCFKENECAVIPAGQMFAVRYFDNCTGYMGGFNDEYLNCNNDGKNILQSFEVLRRWGAHKVYFGTEHAKYIKDIFERLEAESTGRKSKNIIRAYLTTLLTEIEEASFENDSEDMFHTENDICNKYIELVFNNNKLNIPLSEYAEKLNVTKNYLLKVVKRFTSKTPLAWIFEAVVLEAKVLLSQTAMTINEIAFHVGIDDPSYFSRLFKKQTGVTPQEYRQNKKSLKSPL